MMNRTMKRLSVVCLLMLVFTHGCSRGGGGGASDTGAGVNTSSDLEFAKTAFTAMANGDAAAEQAVDWEHFTSVGTNIGPQYMAMPDEAQKSAFRKAFLASFSKSFLSTGATAESLSNWRIQSQDAALTIVAADTLKKTVFTVTVSKRDGAQKLSSLGFGQ